ncbi:MAG: hypothetical protein ACD_12C00116G0004 [uncultured bacterium]|nr:MAG: hypothetical protein ACD_12C00116G0004 [uncultured bacterium]
MLVFIDDSGDPGFKLEKGSSKVFVIAMVIFKDNLEAERVSLAIKDLRRKLKMSDLSEFKFNKSSKKFRKFFIETVKTFDFKIRAIAVNKNDIYSQRLKTHKENFYNYVIMQVIKHSKLIKNAKLKFDKRGEIEIRNQLRVYLSRELDNKKNNIFSDLKFVDSRQNTLIQLADMVAGSIFSFYTDKDKSYLEELRKSKKVEDVWTFK